jgi:hypothetical protein
MVHEGGDEEGERTQRTLIVAQNYLSFEPSPADSSPALVAESTRDFTEARSLHSSNQDVSLGKHSLGNSYPFEPFNIDSIQQGECIT